MHVHSDSEMEIEAEHYTNGVVEGSSARIMNGTYKHEEILQPDDNSIGNGVTGKQTHTYTHWSLHAPVASIWALFLCSIHLSVLWCTLLRHSFYSPLGSSCFHVCTSTVCPRMCLLPEEDGCTNSRQLCGGNQAATERMIQFGRELQALNEQLCREYGKNATHKKMLQVHTFSRFHQTAVLQWIKRMPELRWADFFCWHQLKSW